MAGGPLDLWNRWSIQILVLLSLSLQVVLSVFAGIRRREAHPVLRFVLWQAYLLADPTAIYALGHLFFSGAPREHQLVGFWAPFLLLHLGGPDSITAYALQDNQLWLRHLQILLVQVLAAAYVLYKHFAGSRSLLLLAAILMIAVGVVKYGERTWALRCGKMDSFRSSLRKEEPLFRHHHFHPLDQGRIIEELADKDEFYLRRAHSQFHICKRAIVDSWIEKDPEKHSSDEILEEKLKGVVGNDGYKGMWVLLEMELSLMYDILYTKAAVIHNWRGYCIRVVSPLATAASFLLFQFSGKDGHSRVDVSVTYALLAGAFLLETTSLLRALGSTWTYAFLCATRWSWLRYAALCTGRWDRLRRLVKTISRRRGGRARRWSGKMGQYSMLHLCSRRDRACSPLLGRLAKMLGFKEWWNRKHYSGTVEISDELKQQLFDYIKPLVVKNEVNTQGVLRKAWGQVPLVEKDREMYNYFKDGSDYLGVVLQEGIIIWHVGTDVFLAKSSGAKADDAAHLVKAIRTLSDYMMFLLVERPYMLPGLAQSRLYHQACENLVDTWNKAESPSPSRPNRSICSMLKELFRLHDDPSFSGTTQREELAIMLYKEQPDYSPEVPRLAYANRVAEKLLEKESERGSMDVLTLVRDVWIDFLVHAANQCSRESHAKKLSSGGELTTVLWLMLDYIHQYELL